MSTATATQPLWFIDNLARVHLDGDDTRQAYGLVEITGRQGDMPPLHVHHREDECFYVVEGELTVFVGDQQRTLRAGESALAPRGVPHVYRVESSQARWLAIASPSGFERFVREVSEPEPAPADALPPEGRPHDPAALARIAATYDIEILGPPGALPAA